MPAKKEKPLTVTVVETKLETKTKDGKVTTDLDIGVEPTDIETVGDELCDVEVPIAITIGGVFTKYSSMTSGITIKLKDIDTSKVSLSAVHQSVTREVQWLVYTQINILFETVGKKIPFNLSSDYGAIRSEHLRKGRVDVSYNTSIKMPDAFGEYSSVIGGVTVHKKNVKLGDISLQNIVNSSTERQLEIVGTSLNRQMAACGEPALFDL